LDFKGKQPGLAFRTTKLTVIGRAWPSG